NNVVDVLQHGYGTSKDIALLFAAMARAAGFEAIVALSTDRSERLFEPTVLQEWQLASPIVMVNFNGKQVVLDPGTRFCPFGLLRWNRTATQALLLEKSGGVMVNIPLSSQANGLLERTADVEVATDGTLSGDVTVRYNGYEAMERRLDALQTDEAGRKKKLEEELQGWLPMALSSSSRMRSHGKRLMAHSKPTSAFGCRATRASPGNGCWSPTISSSPARSKHLRS